MAGLCCQTLEAPELAENNVLLEGMKQSKLAKFVLVNILAGRMKYEDRH